MGFVGTACNGASINSATDRIRSAINAAGAARSAANRSLTMSINKRRMESERKAAADKEAATRHPLTPQMVTDAAKIVATIAWSASG